MGTGQAPLPAARILEKPLVFVALRIAALLAPLGALALLAGWIGGAGWAGAVLAVGLVIALARQLAPLGELRDWLRHPEAPVPAGSGAWGEAFEALHRQIRMLRAERETLSGLLARFRSALLAIPDGVMVLDARNHIEWCNANAEDSFGIELGKDAGQSVVNLVRQPEFVSYLERGVFDEPLLLRLSRGEGRVLSLRVVPYGRDQKLLLSRDVTQEERVETVRRDFIANVSHEMKTPLTVLGGFVEMLSEGKVRLTERRGAEVLDMMQEQTGRMTQLLEDLLTLSALESSPRLTDERPLDMTCVLRALQAEGEALSAGRHRITSSCEGPRQLLGNERELRSAFGNLVSNAVRYTPEGGEIRLSWGWCGEQAAFTVADNGIGIEERHLGRLTERFYRVDSSRSRATGGTGLGLAIVKHVLSRHQAMLEIASEPGRGSSFSAVFPARRLMGSESISNAA